MIEKNIHILLQKYRDGTASGQEQTLLLSLVQNLNDKTQAGLVEEELLAMQKEIAMGLGIEKQTEPKRFKLWPRIAAAVAVVLVLFTGGYMYLNRNIVKDASLAVADIEPGRTAATLTLSDGRKIYIADVNSGKVAEETGVKITKNEKGELIYTVMDSQEGPPAMQTLTTYRGETQAVVLPDGSRVWLNAASSIRYPSSFAASQQRKVELTGEAYFEIAKDKAHPFIVATEKQEVEVLGTHFNINSYGDENAVKTTLLEGSVRVRDKGGKEERILSPGMQSSLTGDMLSVAEVDVDDAVAWKEGFFVFDNATLSDVMRQVARWYNVEVEYRDQSLKNKKFSGSVSRFEKVSQVLKKLQQAEAVSFRIEGQKIIAERKTE